MKQTQQKIFTKTQKIDKTTYIVNVSVAETGEPLEAKLLRIIREDVINGK